MNTDLAASSLRSARTPSVSSFFPRSRSGERRSRPRRNTDRQQALLAGLAGWFADRQAQPLFIVDGRMTVLLLNDSARRFLSSTKVLRISAGKLAFRSDKHRVEINRVLKKEENSASLSIRIGASIASVSVERISLPESADNLFLVNVLSASSGEQNHDFLCEKLGLTRAESQITMSIFNGMSLVAIAKARRASINTVKTQVRHIFQKCRVKSQVELVRQIFSTVPVSGD